MDSIFDPSQFKALWFRNEAT